jgi:hypothetical protein
MHIKEITMSEDIFDLEDRRRIELGLSVRERIITELTKGNQLPTSTSDKEFLLRAIEGMDDTIMKRIKIKSEDKLQEAQNQMANNVAELLKRVQVNKSGEPTAKTPILGADIKVEDVVEGETHIGVNSEEVRKQVLG